MKKLFLLILFFCFTSSAHAQQYITISAANDCSADASTAINNAITTATKQGTVSGYPDGTGSVIYFPPGCYLINSTIVDSGAVPTPPPSYPPLNGLSYEGLGRVELRAGSSLTGSIMKFGTDTTTAGGRRISNIFFNCNIKSLDAIDIDGLVNSEFSNIEIRDCGNYAIRTVGSNGENYSVNFEGGLIGISEGVTLTNANGISLSNGSNSWTFKGTAITYGGSGTPTGTGLEIEDSAALTCLNCTLQGWKIGLWAGNSSSVYSLEFSGGYFEFNQLAGIILGNAATSDKVFGATIHGAYISGNCPLCTSNSPSGEMVAGIDLRQVDGFSIFGNRFLKIGSYAIRGLFDSTSPNQGADNGIVGPNNLDSTSATYSLQGSNNTLFAPACTSSASPATCGYTASGYVALPAGSSTLTVDAPFVSSTSRIWLSEDTTLGSQLGVTCNTVVGRTYSITSKTAATSFNITASTAPSGNPACLVFHMEN